MQIVYEKNGRLFDMGTREGREEILGKSEGKTIFVHNESGELISFYNHPEQIDRNTQLIKSLRQKYPGVSLRKAVDFYEQELLLKAKREKTEMMLKSKQIKSSKPKKTAATSNWDLLLDQLDALTG